MGLTPATKELWISNMAEGTSSFLGYLSPAMKEGKRKTVISLCGAILAVKRNYF